MSQTPNHPQPLTLSPDDTPHLKRVRVQILGTDYDEILDLSTYRGWNLLGDVLWNGIVVEFEIDDTIQNRRLHQPFIATAVAMLVYAVAHINTNEFVLAPEPWGGLKLTRLANRAASEIMNAEGIWN